MQFYLNNLNKNKNKTHKFQRQKLNIGKKRQKIYKKKTKHYKDNLNGIPQPRKNSQ